MRVMKLLRSLRRNNKGYEGDPYSFFPVPPIFMPIALVAKLHEEVEEVRAAMNDPEEYGDVLQALYDLGRINGVSPADMETSRLKKLGKSGDFISDPAMCYRGDLSNGYDGLGKLKWSVQEQEQKPREGGLAKGTCDATWAEMAGSGEGSLE